MTITFASSRLEGNGRYRRNDPGRSEALGSEGCAWNLAPSGHARSGDGIAIAAYLGKSDVFDQAIGEFSVAYADQNERDYAAMKDAVRTGWLQAETGI